MFAARYFGGRYFAPRYFGEIGDVPVVLVLFFGYNVARTLVGVGR